MLVQKAKYENRTVVGCLFPKMASTTSLMDPVQVLVCHSSSCQEVEFISFPQRWGLTLLTCFDKQNMVEVTAVPVLGLTCKRTGNLPLCSLLQSRASMRKVKPPGLCQRERPSQLQSWQMLPSKAIWLVISAPAECRVMSDLNQYYVMNGQQSLGKPQNHKNKSVLVTMF